MLRAYMTRRNILTAIAILAVFIGGLIFYLNRPQELTNDQVVAKVGELILLPQGEKPTIGTVSDPSLIKSQPFFAQAEVGDKILIFSAASRAYLYRPSINKLVEVSPITINANPTHK